MSTAFSINFDAQAQMFLVAGELSFVTASAALEQSEPLFDAASKMDIDLKDVTRSDSAGVALLIAWMRLAKQNNKVIIFHNIPEQMMAIASSSGLDEQLPIQ
jgi:phospholipid transport system transporter-binding protein